MPIDPSGGVGPLMILVDDTAVPHVPDPESPDYCDLWWTDGDTVATVESAKHHPCFGVPYRHTTHLTASRDGQRILTLERYRYAVRRDHIRLARA